MFAGQKEQVVVWLSGVEKAVEEVHKKTDLGQVMKGIGRHVRDVIRT